MVDIHNLVSHRFRGFAPYENTVEGLKSALDFGVKHIEFDIRVAKCGTPMIYHDESAPDKDGKIRHLCDVMAKDFKTLAGTFGRMSSAEDLFSVASQHSNKAKLLIDIKDAGFESEIYALVRLNKLGSQAVYVSWVPEALYAMYDLHPEADFCLSHWCKRPDVKTRRIHKVFSANQGRVSRPKRRMVHGERSGWYLDKPLSGRLRDIVSSVCVPQAMVTRELVENYHKDDIAVSTFSYLNWPDINRHKEQFNVDLYFIDNKKVFDEI